MVTRGLQEGRGGKVGCRFHLLLCNSELISELMITEGNKQKRQSLYDPAFKSCFSRIGLKFWGTVYPTS
jgi:hypothetical protein